MQAFLQYRSLEKQVKAHLETKLDYKSVFANNLTYQPTWDSISPSTSAQPALTSSDEQQDIEVGAGAEATQTAAVLGYLPDDIDDHLQIIRTSQPLEPTGTRLGVALTGVDVRSRTTIEDKSLGRVFIVGFDGPDDPANPHNWSIWKRIVLTVNVGLITWVVGLASAIDSAALPQAAADFGVSVVAENLATGLFLAGIGLGAFVAGPISETVGRNPVYIVSLAIFMLFIMGAGLSHSLGAQLTCRFFAGFFGGSPFSVVGGSLGDMWNPMQRIIAFSSFGCIGFLGPVMGPVAGGFIGESDIVSWRWVEWTSLIASGLIMVSVFFLQSETYAPIILKWKAIHLRRCTADNRYVSTAEIRPLSFVRRLEVALSRPFIMTIKEPTIMLWTGYLTVIYIMLFGFLAGYTFIFQDTYKVSQGITGLIFAGIGVGYLFAAIPLNLLVYRWARQKQEANQAAHSHDAPFRLPPEFRLWYGMLGAPAIPISLFWMGWTAYSSISIWSPILASVLFGYGVLAVFLSTYQYLIETYEIYAASALTMISLVRYAASGGMTVAMIPIYRAIGVHWTLTWLALLGVIFAPVPYLFYHYGPWIRSKSKFAPS